ncbi:MAG: aldose 1-epimerase [Sphingomonadaceae bacterium]|nr:aldose 1-epimerase [Sphingomonadaceae bacterium]
MRAGALEAALFPAVGGSLAWLAYDGADLLRRAPQGSVDPLAMASFPLVPYANRIADGRFDFDGQCYQLPRNFGDHPHTIHGNGWQRGWSVAEQSKDEARLALDHRADAHWPWDYRAEQLVTLTPDAIIMTLMLTNNGDRPMPAGLGFHPYFVADDHTGMQFATTMMWQATPDMLPERQVPADAMGDWARGGAVRGKSLIDNVYGGWDGVATVTRGDGLRLKLSAQGADWLHVFRPPDSADFCLEPVSHMPDAINRDGAMTIVESGATIQLSMAIVITRCDEALPNSDRIA